jgi:uncharacterized repeat protein (TIGR03803 family)
MIGDTNMKFTRLSLVLAALAVTFGAALSQAQTYTDLANFNGENGDGPFGSVTQATDGNFYGTTNIGGAYREGEVFRMSPTGEITSIYSFCSLPNCTEGANPESAPVLGSDGNLYGAALQGGNKGQSGTIYKMTLDGQITVLYTFCATSPCTDGEAPNGIILASDGNFYGTTSVGGQNREGTIFKISPTGQFTLLYSFCSQANCADGWRPMFPPIQGSDGNFYGTAMFGGSLDGGVLYELTSSGTYTVLHNFCNQRTCPEGAYPNTIVQDAQGNFIGTTEMGGKGYGTVFELTSTDQYSVIDSFDYVHGTPVTGLTLASDGNLYGTTIGDGSDGGFIYEVTPEGRYMELHAFTEGSPTGYSPWGTPFQGTDGLLYGTTLYGGANADGGCGGCGTIYTVANGPSPLVEPVPIAGPAGQNVLILGNNLTGSTSVTFNGVAADFTVESDTYIQATVPSGATTGTISVVTPSGTLNSNPQFVVTK